MQRPKTIPILLSLLLLGTALPARAQAGEGSDSTAAVKDDSSARPGQSWLVALLKKIARRDDDRTFTANGSLPQDDDGAVTVSSNRSTRRLFTSRKDSAEYESARALAMRATGFRIVVDIFAHQLYVIDNEDTLRVAPVATAMNETLSYGGRTWRFVTPRGVRRVLSKDKEPAWKPPEWHYAEVAVEHHLRLRQLQRGHVVRLEDGTRLLTRGDEVGIIAPGEREFVPLVLDEHIVFDNTLFIPPPGTSHSTIQGELGHYRLALGDGYQLHGTPYTNSIGAAVTHGCVRLRDEDIEWLYEHVPLGSRVYIY